MSWYTYSGFADEIDPMLSVQMDHLDTLGIKYIEARGIDNVNISKVSEEDAREIKKCLDARGFRISALGSPIGKIKITDSFDGELELFKHVLRLAQILDTDKIRLFSFYVPAGEAEKYRDEVLFRMQKYVNAAKGMGICLLHENEKDIYGDTDLRCLDIHEALGSDILFATFDPANYVQCGVDTKQAAQRLLPYIKYMHIKDALKSGDVVPAGQGDGNIKHILSRLKENGYKGFVSLEPHLADFSGFAELEDGDVTLKKSDNKAKFTLAYNSLREIIESI